MHRFELLINRMPTDDEVNRLFATHDDMGTRYIPVTRTGAIWVDREAPSTLDALLTAIRDCDAVGLRAIGVEPDWGAGYRGDFLDDFEEIDAEENTLTAVDLALRMRDMAPRVDRMSAITALIAG